MKKNRKKRKRWLWFCALLLAAAVAGLMLTKCNTRKTITFKESTEKVENPFQGTYFQWSSGDAEGIYDVVKEHPDYRVILLTYNLNDEREMEVIPKEKTEDLERALKIAEELKLSVIFRAAYDFEGQYEDPDFDIMLSHIEQTAEVLNVHKQCIMGVQAGMIGAFGEWTQSKYMDTKKYRMQVIEAWEKSLAPEIDISVRRQKFIREAQEWGLDTTRLGVYNDGLFSSESDLGTYREDYDREEDLSWSEQNIKVPFNGGEMPFVSEFSEIENVVKEARQLNLSYLNQEYNHEVWEFWASQKYEDLPGDVYIKRYLGCRPWVKTLSIDRNPQIKSILYIDAELKNSGFAMLNPDYHIYFVLICGDKTVVKEAEGGMESKDSGKISLRIENPFFKTEIKKNGISIGIKISKEEPEYSEEAYCLKLANDGITYKDGINILQEID